jgi:predicted Zn-dependent peptidase
MIAKWKAVTPADVQAVATACTRPEQQVVLLVNPAPRTASR